LGKSKHIDLSVEEKTELTNLILIENPTFSDSFEITIKLGLIIVGVHTVYEHITREFHQQRLCDRILKNLDIIDTNTQLENMGFFR